MQRFFQALQLHPIYPSNLRKKPEMKHLRHCVSLILCLSLLLDIAPPCFAQVNSDSAVRPEQTGNGAVSLSFGEEKEESPHTFMGEDRSRREE